MSPRKVLLGLLVASAAWSAATVEAVSPVFNYRARYTARGVYWHRGYHDPAWGVPYAIAVPRRANLHTTWQWGVTGTSIEPNYNEYIRRPGPIDSDPTVATPPWPSHTDQFGGYYVRTLRQ